MKLLSLPLLGVLTALALLTGACKKDEQPTSDTVIVSDPRTCACCGGLVLNTIGITRFSGSGTYSISDEEDLNIDSKDLPLNVRAD